MQRAIEGVASIDIASRRLVVTLVAIVMVPQYYIPVQYVTNQTTLSEGPASCDKAAYLHHSVIQTYCDPHCSNRAPQAHQGTCKDFAS